MLRSCPARGDSPGNMIALLVLTRAFRNDLRSRNLLCRRIRKELHKLFSKGEIEMLLKDIE